MKTSIYWTSMVVIGVASGFATGGLPAIQALLIIAAIAIFSSVALGWALLR